MYRVYRNHNAVLIGLFLHFSLYTRGQWADVLRIPESGCFVYLSLLFFIFLSIQFSNIKRVFFYTLFSGTMNPRRLKLSTHVDSGQIYCVYRNQAAPAYSSLYFLFFFLSNFQT